MALQEKLSQWTRRWNAPYYRREAPQFCQHCGAALASTVLISRTLEAGPVCGETCAEALECERAQRAPEE